MDIEIIEEGAGKVEIVQQRPDDTAAPFLPGTDPTALRGHKFTGLFQSFTDPGFSAWFNHYEARHKTTVRARANIPVLELRVTMGRPLEGEWDRIADPLLPPRCFNIYYTPFVDTKVILEPGEYFSFDLHPSPEWLQTLGVQHAELDRFLARVAAGRPATLYKRPQPADEAMKHKLFRLRHMDQEPALRERLVHHHTALLMLHALEPLVSPAPEGYQVLHRDKTALREAQNLIAASLDHYPGNEKLCRLTGLNELKLLKGFKALFGQTPADYHLSLRMERARKLLIETDRSVSQIGWELGYELSSSFSRRFREYTGMTPQEFRGRRR